MKTVSLCMIVKNEEDVIARCLESAREIADEIIVVDTGSTDRTKELCAAYTDKVFDFVWRDDFAAARNFGYAKARMDYCMWLDADDVISPADAQKFLELKRNLTAEDVVMCRYHVAFDAEGNPSFSYYRERLTRRAANFVWEGCVHECIAPRGQILYSDAAVTHKKERPAEAGRNLRIYRSMQERGAEFSPRHLFYFGRELYYNAFYEEAAEIFGKFLTGGKGWMVNCIDACSLLADCYKRLGKDYLVLPTLFDSFQYERPHAEICCDVGNEFFERGHYETAAFWYETALGCTPRPESGGFVQADCYDVIPLLQLCVCQDRLGNRRKAEEYNRRAASVRPNHPSVRANLEYFAKLK